MQPKESNRLLRLKTLENLSKETNATFSQELFETATILSQAQREIMLNHTIPLIKVFKKSLK